MFAAFPCYDQSYTAWFGLIPLLLALAQSRPIKGFFLFFIFGVVFYTGIFYWMFDLPKYKVLHHAVLGIYLCPLLGFIGIGFCFINRRRGIAFALASLPFIWVAQEYIRSNLSFLSLPWGLLGHSQYQHPLLIQVASLTGVWGVSFLIVLVNSTITAIFFLLIGRKTSAGLNADQISRSTGPKVVVASAIITVFLTLSYGYVMLAGPLKGKEFKIAVVQGNIDQSKKWDPKHAPEIMQIYTNLTEMASAGRPDLIVWPETATPKAINLDPKLYSQVKQIAKSNGTYLLIGSSQLQKFKVKEPKSAKYMNSAFLIAPIASNARDQQYDKIRLLPFSEYLPYKDTISWSYLHIPDVDSYVPGRKFTIFGIGDFRFGVTICWENIFADVVRQFVRNGALCIINITNEAWFGKSAAPYQFMSMSVFRAVENRVHVIRCANTGISCFIDPCGRIEDRVKDNSGKDLFVQGILTRPISPFKPITFYTRFGDWFVWLCIFATTVVLIVAFLSKNPAEKI